MYNDVYDRAVQFYDVAVVMWMGVGGCCSRGIHILSLKMGTFWGLLWQSGGGGTFMDGKCRHNQHCHHGEIHLLLGANNCTR